MAELTDKEITEACARATGRRYWNHLWLPETIETSDDGTGRCAYIYNPLTDRAQAMEIQERLKPTVSFSEREGKYRVSAPHDPVDILDASLLRAICLCAARVQIEKEKNA